MYGIIRSSVTGSKNAKYDLLSTTHKTKFDTQVQILEVVKSLDSSDTVAKTIDSITINGEDKMQFIRFYPVELKCELFPE